QILFWYRAVLAVLPNPRQGYRLPFGANLNSRGLIIPRAIFGPEFMATVVAFGVAIVLVIALAAWARRRQAETGRPFPTFWTGLLILIGVLFLVFLATGAPLAFEFPELKGFNFVGGANIRPEFVALLLALSLYTATYIAEIVRAGILAVAHGQTEASHA